MPQAKTVAALLLIIFLAIVPSAVRSQARTPVYQTVDVQIPFAPTPVTIEGKRVLAYELHVTNLRSIDVVLTRVALTMLPGAEAPVSAPPSEWAKAAPLADYRDSALAKKLGRPGVASELADKRVIGGGLRAVVYVWLTLDGATVAPKRLGHRIEIDAVRPSGREHEIVTGPEIDARLEQPVVLGPPLRGGPWVALYDPMLVGGHRTSIYTMNGHARIPARFAIDWVGMSPDGSKARGDATKVANWHGFGADVLAVADAIVAEARDDMPGAESIGASQGAMPLENASGNHVVLDLGGGRFAFYEHLKHGSVRVKKGERVKRGQLIAQLGNTGSSSSGPHLHFHVANTESLLGAEGLPYVFSSFEVVGEFESIEATGSGKPWKPAAENAGGERKLELPGANVVLRFKRYD